MAQATKRQTDIPTRQIALEAGAPVVAGPVPILVLRSVVSGQPIPYRVLVAEGTA